MVFRNGCILGLLVELALASAAGAQQRGATVRGRVADSAGLPLEAAEIELVGTDRRTLSGVDGEFRFEGLRNGRYWLLTRYIGYRPSPQSITLSNNEIREIRIFLAKRPVTLPEVVVKAENKMYQIRMRDFLWRSRASFGGRFLTRDDIARAGANRLGDLVVRYMPFKSMWVMDQPGGWADLGWSGNEDFFSPARHLGRTRYRPSCPPAVAINGGGVSAGWAVNDFVPDELEALEIYREGTTLPIEYSFPYQTACGLVVVWLKNFARP